MTNLVCKLILASVACIAAGVAVQAQTYIFPGIKFVEPATSETQDWIVNSSATESQGFLFPGTIGTAGQVLRVGSASNGNATFSWSTPTASVASTSKRLTDDVTESTAWDTGPDIPVASNKVYRIVGEFTISRGNTGGGGNDKFKLRINLPNSTCSVAYYVDCYDCPTGTLGVPQFAEGTATSVQLADDIDPGAGAGEHENEPFRYRIEGVVKTSTVAENSIVRLTFNKSQNAEDTKMLKHSYWTLIEIN